MPLFEPRLQHNCQPCVWLWIMLAGCSVPTEGSALETSIGAGRTPMDAAFPHTPLPVGMDTGVQLAPDAAADGDARPRITDPPYGAIDAAIDRDDAAVSQTRCPAGGTFAVRTEMDVDWEQTLLAGIFPILEAGAGKLSLIELMRFEKTEAGDPVARVRQCGASVPQFEATLLGERYAVDLPDTVWEAPQMPRWDLAIEEQSCFEPGCALESKPLDALLGLSLPDPAGPWPSRPDDPEITYLDHDGDGRRGVTAMTRGPQQVDSAGRSFSHPPLDVLLIERASHIMLSIRMHTTLQAGLLDCEHFSGMSRGTRLETRVAACISRTEGGERPCSAGQTAFVDANMPVWKVRSTHWTGVRVPDDATCTEARAPF